MLSDEQIDTIAYTFKAKLTALNEQANQVSRSDLWEFTESIQELTANLGAYYVDRATVYDGCPHLEGIGAAIGARTAAFRQEFDVARREEFQARLRASVVPTNR